MMRKKDKKKCTQLTEGIVIDVNNKGLDFPTIITVQYEVAGVSYRIAESKKYSNETTKIGFIPISQKKIPKLGNVVVGSSVSVSYNPNCPKMAFLTNNVGKINV